MKKILITAVLTLCAMPVLALADGMTDFNMNCSNCHGGSAKTNAKRAGMLKVDPKKIYLPASEMDKGQMTVIVEKGKDKMPAFEGKLTKDQIAGIVDYVKSLKQK
jgi:mono/diheme cytochrome c family protein